VVRTHVGYAGGTTENPTYHNLGGHSETIQIEYDPTRISYQELLDVFWAGHAPTQPAWSRQYASLIFYHDEEQRRLAQASKERYEAQCDCQVYTEI
jgi:methionine-S-sulfoxide reductase